jgi:hypothetical protein
MPSPGFVRSTKPVEQWRLRNRLTPSENSEYSDFLSQSGEYSELSEYPNGVKEKTTDGYEEVLV